MSYFKLPWVHGTTCAWVQGKKSTYSVETIQVDGTVCYSAFVKGKFKATYMQRGEAMRRCEAYDSLPWWNLTNPFK